MAAATTMVGPRGVPASAGRPCNVRRRWTVVDRHAASLHGRTNRYIGLGGHRDMPTKGTDLGSWCCIDRRREGRSSLAGWGDHRVGRLRACRRSIGTTDGMSNSEKSPEIGRSHRSPGADGGRSTWRHSRVDDDVAVERPGDDAAAGIGGQLTLDPALQAAQCCRAMRARLQARYPARGARRSQSGR